MTGGDTWGFSALPESPELTWKGASAHLMAAMTTNSLPSPGNMSWYRRLWGFCDFEAGCMYATIQHVAHAIPRVGRGTSLRPRCQKSIWWVVATFLPPPLGAKSFRVRVKRPRFVRFFGKKGRAAPSCWENLQNNLAKPLAPPRGPERVSPQFRASWLFPSVSH